MVLLYLHKKVGCELKVATFRTKTAFLSGYTLKLIASQTLLVLLLIPGVRVYCSKRKCLKKLKLKK